MKFYNFLLEKGMPLSIFLGFVAFLIWLLDVKGVSTLVRLMPLSLPLLSVASWLLLRTRRWRRVRLCLVIWAVQLVCFQLILVLALGPSVPVWLCMIPQIAAYVAVVRYFRRRRHKFTR